MNPTFQTVFDLIRQPNLIQPAYWFIAIFVFAAVILVTLAWLAVRRRRRWRRSLPIFAVAWVAICTYVIATDVRDTIEIRNAVVAGKVQVAEGCLDYFRPGSPQGTKSTAGNEEWSVDGRVFNYGAGEVRPAFHAVSTAEGPVRADSRVRVSFVVSPAYGRREIVKLELAPHACPNARLVNAFDQP
ncbi:hypothetical protein [Sphingomonas sp. IC081]|uniref:hypothetical protein n=1 Tax=Sphingomonas sp. IC081 TaxID=304378 RepID=UPI00115902A3|nr:hypothetical protein [Sphingomonas sp. IC081]QDK34749.1 hypothetical protein DM450_0030 [Sphingomonas sp. IC081]